MSHSRTVKDTGLPDDPLWRKAGDLLHVVRHEVKWICDHDDDGSGGVFFDARTDLGDNVGVFSNEIFSRHARLSRKP